MPAMSSVECIINSSRFEWLMKKRAPTWSDQHLQWEGFVIGYNCQQRFNLRCKFNIKIKDEGSVLNLMDYFHNKKDHLRMSNNTGSSNHLRSIDLFWSMIIKRCNNLHDVMMTVIWLIRLIRLDLKWRGRLQSYMWMGWDWMDGWLS